MTLTGDRTLDIVIIVAAAAVLLAGLAFNRRFVMRFKGFLFRSQGSPAAKRPQTTLLKNATFKGGTVGNVTAEKTTGGQGEPGNVNLGEGMEATDTNFGDITGRTTTLGDKDRP